MIRVTVELIPHGKEEDKTVIALGEIANNLKGTLEYGSYNYMFTYRGKDNKPMVVSGVLKNHKRSDSVIKLLHLVLRNVGLDK
jgi:hypothetical protein